MTVLETERLRLRRITTEDAEFMLGLLNEPSFLQFVGDRGVRNVEDSRRYIADGPVASYERHGFGLYLVELKRGGTPVGICGLLQRDSLNDVDIGFAFLPAYWGKGYAHESASAVMAYAQGVLNLARVVAVTTPDNHTSIKLLEKLGMRPESKVKLSEDGPELELFARAIEERSTGQ